MECIQDLIQAKLDKKSDDEDEIFGKMVASNAEKLQIHGSKDTLTQKPPVTHTHTHTHTHIYIYISHFRILKVKYLFFTVAIFLQPIKPNMTYELHVTYLLMCCSHT